MSIKLGIDFGTTYTYVFKNENGIITRFGDNTLYDGIAGIPTVIGKLSDDTFVIGAEAIRMNEAEQLKGALQKDLKKKLRKCYQESDDDIDEEEIEKAKKNVKNFFDTLFSDSMVNVNVERIICGMPAVTLTDEDDGTDPITYSGCLVNILQPIFPNAQITCVSEPRLAGQGINVVYGDNFAGNVFVVDLGGGTNDYSVVSVGLQDSTIIAPSVGGNGPGGTEIDKCILDEIQRYDYALSNKNPLGAIRSAKEDVFQSPYSGSYGEGYIGVNGNKTIRISYRGKKTISSNIEIDLSYDVALAGAGGIFEDVAEKVAAYWRSYIQSAGISIDRVFFVGGGARIYPLRKAIIDKINNISGGSYSCGFIGENVSARGNIQVNCSNIVALGAVHYEGGVEKPLGYKFGFNKLATCSIDFMKSEDVASEIKNGYACVIRLDYQIKQDSNKYSIQTCLYDICGKPLFAEPKIWNNRRYKKIYFHFRNDQGKRFPKGNFSISLGKPGMGMQGTIFLIFCYTNRNMFYAWFFPNGNEDTPLCQTIKDAITLYCLDGRINKEGIQYSDIKKIMEDYINGNI